MQNVSVKKSAVALSVGLGIAMGALGVHTAAADAGQYDGWAESIPGSSVNVATHLYASPTGTKSPAVSVYCFDENRTAPTPGSDFPPHYNKVLATGNVLTKDADNERLTGEALNAAVLKVMYNGAPNDAAGIKAAHHLTDDEFYEVTQYAVWYYSDSTGADTTLSSDMMAAYNDLIGAGTATLQTPPANEALDIYEQVDGAAQNLLSTQLVDKDTDQPVTPTSPSTTPTSPSTTPTSPSTTPTSPATTPTSPATTPTSPATTPTSPATTPTSPATTPTSPATTPTSPTTTPTSPTTTPTSPTKPVKPTTKRVTFRVQYDVTTLKNNAQVKALAKTFVHGMYAYRADVVWNPKTGRVMSAPLWVKGVSASKIETLTITVPANATPAQVLDAEKAAAASFNRVDVNKAVAGKVGHVVSAAYLIPAGAWDNTTTWKQGPHTHAQLLAGSAIR